MTNGRDMTLKDQNIHLRIIDSGWDYPKENFLVKCVMSRPWVIIKVLYDTCNQIILYFFIEEMALISALVTSYICLKVKKKLSTKFCPWSSSMTAYMSMDKRWREVLLFFFTTHTRCAVYALFFSTSLVNVFYWVAHTLVLIWEKRSPFGKKNPSLLE